MSKYLLRQDTRKIAAPTAGQTLLTLAGGARRCRACHLWKRATQTVFGEGRATADVMFVGEQPGNEEDLEGRPFVGPAGRVLAQALERAGIARERLYLTNVVKHFKWEPRGKRRIHARPRSAEVRACRPWLDSEIAAAAHHRLPWLDCREVHPHRLFERLIRSRGAMR